MKNTTRRISAILAFAVIFSLFTAFPALGAGAEAVNLAADGDYKYTIVNATTPVHSRSIDGDRVTSYGDGILNNGQKPDYDHNTAALREQFSYTQRTGLSAAGFEITFDLGAVATIENVIVTGYHYTSTFGITPSTTDAALHVSVSDTEDGTYTEIGSTAITAMGSTAQAYVGDIAATGSGRFVKITMDNPAQYTLISEVEIMGTKSASDDVTSDDATSDDVTSDDVTSDDVTSDDTSSDVEDTEINVPTENVAGSATYKGTDMTNGTGNFGEENWTEYHAGKLNDGVIPEGDSNDTKGQNVEIYIDGFVAGTTYVYFDLGAEKTVKEFVAYTNTRLSSTNRGYPSVFNVYVGDSEDVSSATLLGAATTADEGAVRKYVAEGEAAGRYVILELGIATPHIVIALNEVEIYAEKAIVNLAGDATYRGTDKTNGTGNFGEENWNTYHAGKLNDGVIPEGDSNATKGQNVEIYIDGFVAGTTYVYFDLGKEEVITELVAYTNTRLTSTNRGYPSIFNVYVGNSEDIATATLLGAATTTDEGAVRRYSAAGLAAGRYVILELGIATPYIVIALNEVEIMGYGDTAPAVPELPSLEAPVLSSSTGKFTYTIPTITWEAVENAVAYDVYFDGVLVAENVTELSYTPVCSTRTDYNSSNAYKVTVVAKSGSEEFKDSAASEAAEFIYVDMPTDRDGNPVSISNIIIDAGHGGSDPGALGDGGAREEADDNLNMALKVGEFFEKLGYSVAYTRTTDVYETVLTKAAKGEAGRFQLYLCSHRNSFSDERAKGVETLYNSIKNSDNQQLAQYVQDELMKLGVFTNRGIKERNDLTVLGNVTMPAILVELAFISNSDDNAAFDANFEAIALAVVKGMMTYLGDEPKVGGTVQVGETEYTYEGNEIVVDLDATLGEAFTTDIKFDIMNRFGFVDMYGVGPDGAEFDVEYLPAMVPTITTASDGGEGTYTISLGADTEAGTYTYSIFFKDKLGYVYTVVTVNVTFSAPAFEIGDANEDGAVDNLDAVFVLQYDAALIDEDGLNIDLADINGDGIVNNLDATAILKKTAGITE